jgi:hypothetical protein
MLLEYRKTHVLIHVGGVLLNNIPESVLYNAILARLF